MLALLTLEEAKSLYISTGFCKHLHIETVQPYGCGVKIIACMVCAEEIKRVYC